MAFMLHCKPRYAAMQTNVSFLVSGIHRYVPDNDAALALAKGDPMSKNASIGLVPSTNLFGRFLATLDRILMANARAAIRNGDLPYFGL
jgi:hypothetical protein